MLAAFFASNVGRDEDLDAVLCFRGRRWPGKDGPPEASMWEMAAMLDRSDPLGGDVRALENEAYAREKIRALGGTDLPTCLWDLTKGRNRGRKYKGTLPDDHPIVIRLKEMRSRLPEKSRARTAEREPVFEELMPEIERLILAGEMSAAQAAELFGLTVKSFSDKRAWWRRGGAAAYKAARAAKPKKSQAHPPPPLNRAEKSALKALREVAWPKLAEKAAEFRQKLIDLYFPTIAKMIRDRNLKGYDVNKHRSGTPGLREGQPIDLVRELGGQQGSQSAPIRTPPRTNFLVLHQSIAVI
jgi:hypothetical protein